MNAQQIADVIMVQVVYGGNEGYALTSEDRDDFEYTYCLTAANTILAQIHKTQENQ